MTHEEYMRLALDEGRLALATGDVPVGCIIVDSDGNVIGRGHNRREADHSALAHAEVEAIRQACQAIGSWRLHGCTMYVTLEPCPMCAGAIINARISTLVYGAREPLSGSCASIINLFEERYPSRPAIYAGVLAEECAAVMSAFFQKVR